MANLPQTLENHLAGDLYKRSNPYKVKQVLNELGVTPSKTFIDFFEIYCGPIGSQAIPYELQDLFEDVESIQESTTICRKRFDFPTKYLIISNLLGGGVLVLDTELDAIYDVDFEGSIESMIAGQIKPKWNSFHDFLVTMFP